MKTSLAVLCFATATAGLPASYFEANEALLWKNFKDTYNKKYTGSDEAHRRAIFRKNMIKAARFESENPKATFGMNAFSDLSAEEFKAHHNIRVPTKKSPPRMFEGVQAATPVDWRTKGAVTHVKNQAQCGSCWAFSTTGGIEGQWFLAGNTLTSLSEQELVSCDKIDSGCNGGLMDNAFKWLLQAHSGQIVTEASYPYVSGDGISGICHDVTGKAVGATIKGHKDIAHNEDAMAEFVGASGPLSIAVDAQKWQTYTGGILTNCCTVCQLDHGVLIVGYAADYWIVKNSWGASWGENGYIRLKRGANECGLNKSPCTSEI